MENKNQNGEKKAPYLPKSSPAAGAHIGHVIAVRSGKGGVGKSFISSYLSVLLSRKGFKVGVRDCDITGPSIPFAFNRKGPVYGANGVFYPLKSKGGIEVRSSNLLLDSPEDPIVWRGSRISTLIEQFYAQVVWNVDFLILDLAPGTGDISLTVFQKILVDAAVVVATPQSLVSLIVEKSAKMADRLNVPLLSLVENRAYVKCPDCGKRIDIYGKQGNDAELAKKHGIPVFDEIPFDSEIASFMDKGDIEDFKGDYLSSTVDAILNSLK